MTKIEVSIIGSENAMADKLEVSADLVEMLEKLSPVTGKDISTLIRDMLDQGCEEMADRYDVEWS